MRGVDWYCSWGCGGREDGGCDGLLRGLCAGVMFVEALVWWRGVEEVVWCCVRSYEERICTVCMS